MKKTALTVLLIMHGLYAVESSNVQSSSIISLDRIIKNEKTIAASLKNRKYYRGLFNGFKIAIGALGAFQTAVSTANTTAWICGYKQPILLPQNTPVVQSKKEWVLNNIISALGTVGIYYFFAKAEQHYGSADTIRWFVATKQPFYITLREFYFLSQQVGMSSEQEPLILEMQKRFTKLVDQTEYVIAFMRYKAEDFDEKRRIDAQRIIDHAIDRLDHIYKDIAYAIQNDTHNVRYHLDSVLMIFEGDCARFAHAEKSRWINPSAVLDMMNNFV